MYESVAYLTTLYQLQCLCLASNEVRELFHGIFKKCMKLMFHIRNYWTDFD